MIFLSHQHQDKEFVQDIAQTLKDAFGEEKVFYDSWSIKPGENIVEQMNEGLENCKYFFFFITSNSLQSEMVKLEWTSTLMQRSSRDIQFIPVRAENVDVPMVISSLKYLDLANQGLEVTKTQMMEIITGDVEEKHFPAFNNLQVYVLQEGEHKLRYFVMAKRFYEPNAKFGLVTTLNEGEASFGRPTGMAMTGYNPNIGVVGDAPLNVFGLSIESGIQVGFVEELVFTQKVDKPAYISLHHQKAQNKLVELQPIPIQSESDLPRV